MNNPDSLQLRRAKKARQFYLREARSLFPRLDEINRIKRNNCGDLTPELSQEKREIEEGIYKNGRAVWEAFKKWGEEVCGYKPITGEDVRRHLDGKR